LRNHQIGVSFTVQAQQIRQAEGVQTGCDTFFNANSCMFAGAERYLPTLPATRQELMFMAKSALRACSCTQSTAITLLGV
jgi:hypothetical protein